MAEVCLNGLSELDLMMYDNTVISNNICSPHTFVYKIDYDKFMELMKDVVKDYPNKKIFDVEEYVDKIIINEASFTTIVYWKDGTKTVVHCNILEDVFDIEQGIKTAIVKKILGNTGSYNYVIRNLVENAIVYK